MTTINLFANDQHLTTGSKPKIASGDMNSVLLHVEFDPIWDKFTKTAVFFTSNDETVYEMILTDDECTVPHEVLAESGTLFIGIRGICAEDNAIKTSTLVKYRIDDGAPVGDGTTVDPTPDVYQQILKRLNNLETGGSNGTGNNAEVFNGGEPEQASGDHSHAEGYRTKASEDRSHAEGDSTEAGWRSHAEGFLTLANNTSHAGGRLSKATGKGSFAHGVENYSLPGGDVYFWTENMSLDTVTITISGGDVNGFLSVGDFIRLVGDSGIMPPTDCRKIVGISGDGLTITIEHPFGDVNYTTPLEAACYIEVAVGCEASGYGSHAEGYSTSAIGGKDVHAPHAEGKLTKASATGAHAEGNKTTASGFASHAEGNASQATNTSAHAEGFSTTASGTQAHAEGARTVASGSNAHAEGSDTIAKGDAQHAQGRFNVEDTVNKYAHIVGNGTRSTRSNAHTIDWGGNGWFAGDVYVGGSGQDDANAEKLVRSSDLEAKIGGIEAALDGIITIQNKLIGGVGV